MCTTMVLVLFHFNLVFHLLVLHFMMAIYNFKELERCRFAVECNNAWLCLRQSRLYFSRSRWMCACVCVRIFVHWFWQKSTDTAGIQTCFFGYHTDSIQYHLKSEYKTEEEKNCAVFCVFCNSKFEKWHSTQKLLRLLATPFFVAVQLFVYVNMFVPLPTENATAGVSSITLVALSLHLIYRPFLTRLLSFVHTNCSVDFYNKLCAKHIHEHQS